jgi:hypothetical protein
MPCREKPRHGGGGFSGRQLSERHFQIATARGGA